jgi:hypothetical protein
MVRASRPSPKDAAERPGTVARVPTRSLLRSRPVYLGLRNCRPGERERREVFYRVFLRVPIVGTAEHQEETHERLHRATAGTVLRGDLRGPRPGHRQGASAPASHRHGSDRCRAARQEARRRGDPPGAGHPVPDLRGVPDQPVATGQEAAPGHQHLPGATSAAFAGTCCRCSAGPGCDDCATSRSSRCTTRSSTPPRTRACHPRRCTRSTCSSAAPRPTPIGADSWPATSRCSPEPPSNGRCRRSKPRHGPTTNSGSSCGLRPVTGSSRSCGSPP